MLLRTKQIEPYLKTRALAFEQEMVVHLADFAKPHFRVIQEDGTREVIRLGMKEAAKYGFTQRGPVRLFLETMYMFGSGFATDPQHRWVQPALVETMPDDQMYRAELLFEGQKKYLAEVAGPGNEYTIRSLERTRQELAAADERQAGIPPGQLDEALIEALDRIYPEKVAFLGREGLSDVIATGQTKAAQSQMRQTRSAAMMVFLVFAMGHWVTNDPLYPWVRSTLEDSLVNGPDDRALRLEAKAKIYLERVLRYLGRA